MSSFPQNFITKSQRHVLLAITFGNILEWYDVYLYIYWAPILSRVFFSPNSHSLHLFNTIAFFALGFFLRPLGGIIFGRLGDHLGRKQSFILSILLMTFPTFILGLLPTYAQVGILAPCLLALTRIFQTVPSGGEFPGVFCYLYEMADANNRKFMTSFAGVGNQIGIGLGILECFILETFFSPHFLITWGWRISFILGGFIGLCGYYLRYRLHETKLFRDMLAHHPISNKSLSTILRTYKKPLLTGIAYGAAQTISFHLISILFPVYLHKMLEITRAQNFGASLLFLALMTLPLPLIGFLGDKFGAKKLLLIASIGMLFLLYPLYLSMHHFSVASTICILGVYALLATFITALWPYIISHLFPTSDRYTCLGLSFNIADGTLGGTATLFGLYLLAINKDLESFIWILLVGCLISLVSYLKMKEEPQA